jgi:hypothetical protein
VVFWVFCEQAEPIKIRKQKLMSKLVFFIRILLNKQRCGQMV